MKTATRDNRTAQELAILARFGGRKIAAIGLTIPHAPGALWGPPDNLPVVPGWWVCWLCRKPYATADQGRQGPRSFCSIAHKRAYKEAVLVAIGMDRCPECRMPGGHSGPCRLGIAERDGWICQLCHKPVDPKLREPNPWCATFDHIVHRSRGGRSSWHNLRLTHKLCNNQRGDKGSQKLSVAPMPAGNWSPRI